MAETPTQDATDSADGPSTGAPPSRLSRLTKVGEPTTRAAKVGWGIYQHIVAVFAAFGLLALIGHFWDIGWKGFLATVVGVWNTTIRPAMTWVLHIVVTIPLSWLGVDFEVPPLVRDYLSVGLILASSYIRTARRRNTRLTSISSPFKVFRPWLELVGFVALWPVTTVVVVGALTHRLVRLRQMERMDFSKVYVRFPYQTIKGYILDFTSEMAPWLRRLFLLYAPYLYVFLNLLFWRVPVARREADDDYDVDHLFDEYLHKAWLPLVPAETNAIKRGYIALLLTLSPVLYLGVLLAINFWVMPYV